MTKFGGKSRGGHQQFYYFLRRVDFYMLSCELFPFERLAKCAQRYETNNI